MTLRLARQNAAFGYINFLLAATLSLATTPLLLTYLGTTTFGTWKSLQRIIEVASLVDGKPLQALKSLLATELGTKVSGSHSQLISSAVFVCLLWTPVVAISLTIGIAALPILLKDFSTYASDQVFWAGGLLAFNAVLLTAATVPCSILIALNQSRSYYLASSITLLTSSASMVFAATCGYGLIAMSAITCAGTLMLGVLCTTLLQRRHLSMSLSYPTKSQIRQIASYGAWINGWALVGALLFATEPLILTFLIGSDAVTAFSLSAFAMQLAASLTLIIGGTLAPVISARMGSRSTDEVTRLVTVARELVLAMATAAATSILLLNETFVSMWAGRSHFIGSFGNTCLAISLMQIAIIRCDAQILEASLAIRQVVPLGLASSLLSFVMGIGCFFVWDSLPAVLLGALLGRCLMLICLPLYVDGLPSVATRFPLRSLVASMVLLLTAHVTSQLLTGIPLPTILAVAACFAVASILVVPSRSTILYASTGIRSK